MQFYLTLYFMHVLTSPLQCPRCIMNGASNTIAGISNHNPMLKIAQKKSTRNVHGSWCFRATSRACFTASHQEDSCCTRELIEKVFLMVDSCDGLNRCFGQPPRHHITIRFQLEEFTAGPEIKRANNAENVFTYHLSLASAKGRALKRVGRQQDRFFFRLVRMINFRFKAN